VVLPTSVMRLQLREWFRTAIAPRMATCLVADIRRVIGVSKRYAIMIRQGYVPHPRHYPVLAKLVGLELPISFASPQAVAALRYG